MLMNKSYRSLMAEAEQLLHTHNLTPTVARTLLISASNKDASTLFIEFENTVPLEEVEIFNEYIKRYISGEPPQYIVGYEYFFGRDFIVNQDVLIPRPETEYLVEGILELCDEMFENSNEISLVDVGTGSGAIGISLKLEEPKFNVTITDISEKAIAVAKCNAEKFKVEVITQIGDMLQPLIESDAKFDVFVSNPPYIPTEEEVGALVKDNEPNIALFGGANGLKFYEEIFKDVHKIINRKALLAFEIGWNQGDTLKEMAQRAFPSATIEIKQDFNSFDRMLFVRVE